MAPQGAAHRLLRSEARALLVRLAQMKPFALAETMVPAAAISPAAALAIERYLARGRRELRARIQDFLRWIAGDGSTQSAAAAQKRMTVLRLRFNIALSQFDLFADALSQRSEPDTGIWLAGLDAVARDALEMPGVYEAPPVICYLDRGAGAAIRRARTRLPGGGDNPVAIIRMPRERMIGSGIASSLVHEVGHQGSALLRLVPSLTTVLGGLKRGRDAAAWALWARWTSEILADLWAVAKVGIASTMGLIAVVSLPRAFVFRITADDPHPSPWMRVLLSCALGSALYPHPQWDRLASLWRSLYPAEGLKGEAKGLFSMLEATMPSLVTLVVNHRPPSLGGASLGEVLASPDREPARLAWLFQTFRASPGAMRETAPSLVFAAVGQAKADGLLGAEGESRLLSNLLKYWALRCALGGARRSTTEATAFVALSSH